MSSLLVFTCLGHNCLTLRGPPFITTPERSGGAITAGGTKSMRRTLLVGMSIFATLTLNFALAGAVSAHGQPVHAMKVHDVKPAHHKGGGTLLFSHGGAIERTPVVFMVFGGAQWSSGVSPCADATAHALPAP